MVAGLLWELGCWVGETKYADSYNPRGYFENLPLKRLQKQVGGVDLLGSFPKSAIGWKAVVRKELKVQNYRGGPWLFKTGVHYSGVWSEFDPIVVKVTRDRDRILESYARYGGIRNSYGPEGTERIVDRGLARLWSLPGLEVNIDRLVSGDTSQFEKVCEKALLPYRKTDFIIPGAFHAG